MRHLSRNQPFLKIVSVVGLMALVLSPFQNCSEPVQLAEQDAVSVQNTLPFAFEEKLDTIAYMSCSNINTNAFQPRAIFTIKAGAYGANSGLRLSEGFMAATKNFSEMERADALFASANNRAATMQLAFRKALGYQQIVLNDPGKAVEGFDFANILAPLDTSGIARRLASNADGAYVSYFSGTPGLGTRFVEQSLRFIATEKKADDLRNYLMGNAAAGSKAYLTATYTQGEDQPYFARSLDPNSESKVYGTGYEIQFGYPRDMINGPQRRVASISEVDLRTNQRKNIAEANWNCGLVGEADHYTFTVVNPDDLKPPAKTKCVTAADPPNSALNGTQRKRLLLARRVLRPEDWWVDPVNRCIVQKSEMSTCYGRGVSGTIVQPQVVYNGTCTKAANNCPHFVTVCERTTP